MELNFQQLIALLPEKVMLQGDFETREILLDDLYLEPKHSLAIWNHSPDGFNWGYGGSGPAQLALAILLEYWPVKYAIAHHQAFKWHFIGALPQRDFEQEINLQKIMFEALQESSRV